MQSVIGQAGSSSAVGPSVSATHSPVDQRLPTGLGVPLPPAGKPEIRLMVSLTCNWMGSLLATLLAALAAALTFAAAPTFASSICWPDSLNVLTPEPTP